MDEQCHGDLWMLLLNIIKQIIILYLKNSAYYKSAKFQFDDSDVKTFLFPIYGLLVIII